MATIGVGNVIPAAMTAGMAPYPKLFFTVAVLCAPYAWLLIGVWWSIEKSSEPVNKIKLYLSLIAAIAVYWFVFFFLSLR